MSPRPVEYPILHAGWPLWLLLVCACAALALHNFRRIGSSQALGADSATNRAATQPAAPPPAFVLRSPVVTDGGDLPVEYTGDGDSITPPLEWSHAPSGTKGFALIMHHLAPDGTKWYWILYDIPPDVMQLPKHVQGVGKLGTNSINGKTEYAPPHSKGPGAKTYILTVYALSAAPTITVPSAQVNRDVLLAAMKDRILAAAELHVVYTRFPEPEAGSTGNGPPPPPPQGGPGTAPGSPADRPEP